MNRYKERGIRMKKSLLLGAVALFSVGLLAGCKGDTDSKGETEKSNKSEKIVVYSNSASDGRAEFLTELGKEEGFNLEVVSIGGTDLLNRVIAEKDAPIADVIFGMNQMMFSTIANEGILKEYEPSWLGEVDESLISDDHLFSPLQEQRVVMVYDKNKINEADAVTSWEDLINNKEYAGKYMVPQTLGGATQNAVTYTIMMNYLDEKGELGVSDKGWNEIETFFANGVSPQEGLSEIDELTNETVDYSYTWLSNIPVVEENYGIELGVVNPSYGVPQTIEQVGIISKDKMNKDVEAFVDFLGSAEVQAKWAEKFGTAPVNKEAQGSMNERVKEVLESTTPQNNDYDFISEHMDEWVEFIELNILGN